MARPVFLWDIFLRLLFGLFGLLIALLFWILVPVFLILNLLIPWHRLWRWFGVWNLVTLRFIMRRRNLYDTSTLPTSGSPPDPRTLPWEDRFRYQRTADGKFNDLEDPRMGSVNTRFGRNFPLNRLRVGPDNELVKPSPREVSRRLLTRDRFKPATSLNVLAAGWIQFMVHDWFNHERACIKKEGEDKEPGEHLDVYLPGITLEKDDPWPSHSRGQMFIRRTKADETGPQDSSNQPPTFLNTETHWWDGSQLYGSDEERQQQVRARDGTGKLWIKKVQVSAIRKEWRLPSMKDPHPLTGKREDPELDGIDLTGFNDNWWVGLSLFHTLFALEHNAICDALRQAYPDWDDEQLFQTARLINAALIAKIHTVEWTPAILGHPTLLSGMRANWWGILGERVTKTIGRLRILRGIQEEISGIPGSEQDHHGVPFSFTEEFVSVYRMHPLIPDDYRFYSVETDELLVAAIFDKIQRNETRPFMDRYRLADLFYSFGVAHPGAISLTNFPRALQKFSRMKDCDGRIKEELLDLASVDLMRDRERAVPRYNEFRRMLMLLPCISYERLVGVPRLPWFSGLTKREIEDRRAWARLLEEHYRDKELLDPMVGFFAEHRPKGFGFSDTAFRIFILMASRRLKSDRFYSDDFKPEVYTPIGMDWINENGLRSVLLRHYPDLGGTLEEVENPFTPWQRTARPSPDPWDLGKDPDQDARPQKKPVSLAHAPIFAGIVVGWIIGALVHLNTASTFFGAFAAPGALWGAGVGAIIGAGCLAILYLLSLVMGGELTPRERSETAIGLGAFFGWIAGAILGLGPTTPASFWGAVIGTAIGTGYWGIRYVFSLWRADRPVCADLTDFVSRLLARAWVGLLAGGLLGVLAGVAASLVSFLVGGALSLKAVDWLALVGFGLAVRGIRRDPQVFWVGLVLFLFGLLAGDALSPKALAWLALAVAALGLAACGVSRSALIFWFGLPMFLLGLLAGGALSLQALAWLTLAGAGLGLAYWGMNLGWLVSGLGLLLFGLGLVMSGASSCEILGWGALVGAGLGVAIWAAGWVTVATLLGWVIGATIAFINWDRVVRLMEAFGTTEACLGALAGALVGAGWFFIRIRCRSRDAGWVVVGAIQGALLGWIGGAAFYLWRTLPWANLRDLVAEGFLSTHAWILAAIFAVAGMAAWLRWAPELTWLLRRSFWVFLAWGKFVGNQPLNPTPPRTRKVWTLIVRLKFRVDGWLAAQQSDTCRCVLVFVKQFVECCLRASRAVRELDRIGTVPFEEKFPGIPIANIKMAKEVPADEQFWPQSLVSWIQVRLYSIFSPMQPKPELTPISADPQKALAYAYTPLHRTKLDPPDLPSEYEGSPDLGSLAVRGPYACYTEKIDDMHFLWDFRKLEEYTCHEGLYKPGVRVLFRLVPTASELRPFLIESELGMSRPGDPTWQLAKKLALCAATTHMSLVRHFNWVHLASGEPLAIATRACLPSDHPLCRLLWPHTYGTQQTHSTVTLVQMVQGGDFDSIFSFTHAGMCRLFEDTYREFKFSVNDPAKDAQRRGIVKAGFDTPTQQNLQDLFKVIHDHAQRYLEIYYPSGRLNDFLKNPNQSNDLKKQVGEILDWLSRLNDLIPPGKGKGTGYLPADLTRDDLAHLLACFIYLVSVQHEMVGTFLWNYQLWTHRQPVRVYKNGQREPLDVYQRLVNANYNLNVERRALMDDFSYLALDPASAEAFRKFQEDLGALQQRMDEEPWAVWKIYPKILEANINA